MYLHFPVQFAVYFHFSYNFHSLFTRESNLKLKYLKLDFSFKSILSLKAVVAKVLRDILTSVYIAESEHIFVC